MEQERKYFFFDIDGTLTAGDGEKGRIPGSCLKTIRALQKKGHLTALATGRNYEKTEPFLRLTGIRDAVCDGGNVIVMDGEIVSAKPLDRSFVVPLLQELQQKKIPYALMIDTADPHIHASRSMYGRRRKLDMEGFPVVIGEMDPFAADIYKVFIEIPAGSEDMIKSADMHLLPRYVDDVLVVEPLGKHEGIKELLRRRGKDLSRAVVFGDEKNDIPMFREIPFSIAMGNGAEELKEIAYYVTGHPEEDGIMNACLHFGWIREEDIA